MKKRAQAAMEFLMTYGWAILVVLAAIGALAYFGVLSPDQFVTERCTLGSDFDCNNALADVDSTTLSLVNLQSETVTIQEVTLTGGCYGETGVSSPDVNTTQQIPPRGETEVLTFTCPAGQTNTISGLETLGIYVNYTRASESIYRPATGEFVARIQE